MVPISPIDEAEFRVEIRKLYKTVGHEGCLQCLYEMLRCAEIFAEVMVEEERKAEKHD